MTADTSNDSSNERQDQGGARKSRGRKAARKRSGSSRSQAAKRGGSAQSRRRASGRSAGQSEQAAAGRSSGGGRSRNRSRSASGASGGFGARLLAGAGRAMPLASGDQRMVQRLVDERPYMLGAIGLGIGAMIGLMLPGALSSLGGRGSRSRSSR